MIKEYWLIKNIKTIGHKNPLQMIDKVNANGLKEAEANFRDRNDFKKLLNKADLIIAKTEKLIV